MIEPIKLAFSYKGEREYIQGPDVANAVIRELKPFSATNLQLSFSGLMNNRVCNLYISDDKRLLPKSRRITCKGKADTERGLTWFQVEEPDDEELSEGEIGLPLRVSYDEALVIGVVVDQKKILSSNSEPSPYSFLETVVSLTKKLHQQCVSDEGKWLFVQLKLDPLVDNFATIGVELFSFSNTRLTKSNVTVDGRCVGEIYFSMVK